MMLLRTTNRQIAFFFKCSVIGCSQPQHSRSTLNDGLWLYPIVAVPSFVPRLETKTDLRIGSPSLCRIVNGIRGIICFSKPASIYLLVVLNAFRLLDHQDVGSPKTVVMLDCYKKNRYQNLKFIWQQKEVN